MYQRIKNIPIMDKGKGITRREFITQSTIAAGIIPFLYLNGQHLKSPRTPFDKGALNKLRKSFTGQIILPGDADYEIKRRTRVWNPDMDKHPAIITSCINEQDVLRSIEFAQKHHLEMAVRSGNHSNMGWGTCENGIVADLSQMKGVTVDTDQKSAVVAPGVTANEIHAATSRYGLAPVLGQVGSVGAGIMLGGGLGWLSGKYGATCDNLIAAQIITANSQILIADSKSNSNLFWAIRGGGGNFGIATSIEYQLHSISEILAGSIFYSLSKAREIIPFFMDFMSTAPDELQGDCHLTMDTCRVEFVFFGDLDQGDRLIEKFRKFNKPEKDTIKRRPYSEIYSLDGRDGPSKCEFVSAKGSYVKELTDEAIDFILQRLTQAPHSCNLFFNLSHFMHGKVCRVLPNETAFELRKPGALHIVSFVTWQDTEDTSACMTWHYKTFEGLQPYSDGRIYSNYMSEKGGATAKAVYGTNFSRLTRLKKQFDPDNFFHLNQNILPESE